MQLTIQAVKTNPSGKSMVVKAGGKDYLAKAGMPLQAGMTIEAETEVSEFNGKQNTWIKAFKEAAAATPTPPAGNSVGGNGVPPAWLPFASNTVAHAINAGLITTPDQVEAWVRGAKDAYETVQKDI